MDFTALELGLRNRQLLQVKCFLKIQIETFRYFLFEDLSDSVTAEQTITFEKFLHDWQNVVNKVSSVAAIQMSGDYSSKVFSILLYRSLIHSCNQLISIVSSSKTLGTNSGHVFIKNGFNISPSSSSSSSENQWFVFKEKILMLLIKQINSIRENLSKINYSENNSASDQHRSDQLAEEAAIICQNLKIANLLKTESSDSKLISAKSEKFQELIEYSLNNQCLPLFIWVMKKYSQDSAIEQLQWTNLVEKIVNFAANKLKSYDQVDLKLIKLIDNYLGQTGLPTLDLLFLLFFQTCNASIRQKLWHIFCICFSDNFGDNLGSGIISKSDRFENFKSNFGYYFQIMSIIDMYIFCYRPKLVSTDDRLEVAMEWILEIGNSDKFALAKSLMLPVLDEITVHPTLFDDWQELTTQIYDQPVFDPFRQNIFIEDKFDLFINAENVWQYLIDNNRRQSLIEWIEKDQFQLPYCSKIQPNDREMCKNMIKYLLNRSPIMFKLEIMAALIENAYFFNQHDFSDLVSQTLPFEDFLALIGQTNILARTDQESNGEDCVVLEKLLNKVIKLSELIEFCVENELFEFLFLLYNRYKIDFEFLSTSSDAFERKTEVAEILKFLHGLCMAGDVLESAVFEKSFFVLRFLHQDLANRTVSFEENVEFMLKMLASKSLDLDFILLVLSFSEQQNFDDLFVVLKKLCNHKSESSAVSGLVKLFLSSLLSKYPLVFRAFQSSFNFELKSNLVDSGVDRQNQSIIANDMVEEIFATSQQTSASNNIYSFLQQSIPFVNITKTFQWQIDRNYDRKPDKNHSNNHGTNREMPHFSLKQLAELYGIKSNLTTSYYLNNSRLIEAFLTFTSIRASNERQIRSMETRWMVINEKSALKAIRKSATIAYSSVKNESIVTSCLLFQTLIKSSLSQQGKNGRSNKTTNGDPFSKSMTNECEKFRLHLALGRLIIEYAADFLDLHGPQQQQNVLASLLRRSHFNCNRNCTQKLLELATVALERKYGPSLPHSDSLPRTARTRKSWMIDAKIAKLFIEGSMGMKEDQPAPGVFESCPLLIECFQWRPLFMFADLYGLKKPLNFLLKCTGQDNWLVFVIFAQMYEIPKEEIQSMLTDADFNNPCIGEHLDKAFQSARHVLVDQRKQFNETESRILKTKQPPSSSRNVLYSKLFKEKLPHPSSVENIVRASSPINEDDDPRDPEPSAYSLDANSPESMSLFSSSVLSRLSGDDIANDYVVLKQKLAPQSTSKDFLQLILDIFGSCVAHSQRISFPMFSIEKSFQITLLYASVSLSNPILALLSCSLAKSRTQSIEINKSPIRSPKFSSETLNTSSPTSTHSRPSSSGNDRLTYSAFACWLLASVDQQSKQCYIDWYCRTHSIKIPDQDSMVDCYTNWSPERWLNLIEVMTAKNVKNFRIIHQGFEIFGIRMPILSTLLDFFIRFLMMKDYYDETIDSLKQFQSLLMEYNEEEFLHLNSISSCDDAEDFPTNETGWLISDFYSRFWIEKCSLIMITNSLLIAKQFEMSILLSHYNFVRIQDSFSPNLHRIPDIRTIYLFSQCLNKLPDHQLPIAELLAIETAVDEPESKYGEVLRPLIFDLQETGHFEAARNIINLLSGVNTNELIMNEWILKAKKADINPLGTSSVSSSINMDLSFWENCWSQVNKLDPSMHSAFKVMQRFVQQLEPSQILIKCFILLKCLLAMETILKDSIDNENEVQLPMSLVNQDDASTVCSSNTSTTVDLIQDYFNLETSFWKSVVDCEFYIQTTFNSNDLNPIEPSNSDETVREACEKNFTQAWRQIWKDVVTFLNSSIMSKQILPKLSVKYPLSYKNVEKQRNKQTILLEIFKQDSLNRVVGNLLDHFCYEKAQEVSELFNYVHEDFEIIQACDRTARGFLKDISDAPLSVQLKMKHSNVVQSGHLNQAKANITSGCNLDAEQNRIVSILETFANFATIGQKFCEYIKLRYKIACLLGTSFSELNDSDYAPQRILEMLLASNQNSEVGDSSLLGDEAKPWEEDGGQSNYCSLIDKYMETILCAKEFIRILGRVDEKFDNEDKIVDFLAQFVCQNVQQIVDQQFKDCLDKSINAQSVTEIELDRTRLEFYSARFSVLIRLLREPSLLGHKLLELAKKLKINFENNCQDFRKDSPSFDMNFETKPETSETTGKLNIIAERKHYVQMVEMYIRAHECFTSQCLVSGIALVLRKTRLLITRELQPARYFHLILRLLTGIGRYSEMTYCFDLFRECDRFELILSKRVQRTPQLRIALLNYLKNAEHIEELLPLVAIRFFLYRETADQHRSRAERLLNELNFVSNLGSSSRNSLARSLPKRNSSNSLFSDSLNSHSPPSFNVFASSSSFIHQYIGNNRNIMKEQLEAIMYEYQEAEINYTKAAAYTNAEHCSRQAQLMALQTFYLNKTEPNEYVINSRTLVTVVVKLDSNQVKEFITVCANFYEALIVSKAYPEVNVEWPDAFFTNAIIQNNVKYVQEFLEAQQISFSFLEKLIHRFESFKIMFQQQNQSVKKLLPSNSQTTLSNTKSPPPSLSSSWNPSPSAAIFIPSSPLPANILASLSQTRSEHELKKIHQILEQFIECVLFDRNRTVSISLTERFRLAKRLNSPRLMQRFLESNNDNFAYLLDLRSNQKL